MVKILIASNFIGYSGNRYNIMEKGSAQFDTVFFSLGYNTKLQIEIESPFCYHAARFVLRYFIRKRNQL
jgi:hypothetical protein